MYSRRIERNAAMAPDTCGAAMLVPLSSTYSASLCVAVRAASSAAPAPHEMIFSPGATTSGLGRPSPVGPLDEKYDTP